MNLGAFSVSLNVTDIAVSRVFYEKLGFSVFGGDQEQNWLIMKNGPHLIGLFQGMFDHNILTFNPGWDQDGKNVDPFTDVRELQREAKALGLEPVEPADETTSGPEHFILIDPDNNAILIDQHR